MDLSSSSFMESSTLFSSQGGATLESNNGIFKNNSIKNPFLDSFSDPLCKLNLKETSEFVKSFPGTESRGFLGISPHGGEGDVGVVSVTRRNVEAPPTPGRPIFSFSNGSFSRKGFPSKWDDAEKWLVSGSSFEDSPSKMYSKQCSGYHYKQHDHQGFAEKSRVITEEKFSKGALVAVSLSATEDVLLKDKFPNEMNPISPKFVSSEPMQETFLFQNSAKKPTTNRTLEILHEVQHRDFGTEMTPLGSSTTSRCPTPFMSTSPARHNTPANRSGPLALTNSIDSSTSIDISQLQECHLAKLQIGTPFDSVTTNWSSREEEEEDVSKSLRHFEMSGEFRKSVSESKSNCAWQEEDKTKSCLRYQREEAKIQAWVNLQSAKAEAESRKLEVKIQKMRANLEEKLMKRMADVHRKAEEWRATAQFQHSEQIRKVGIEARKVMNRKNNKHFSGHKSCGCFPCNNHI